MFGANRDSLRRFYVRCWEKHKQKQALDALEQQIAQVISEHPEYHPWLERGEESLQQDFSPELGETNPFLHMGMHLGLREQVATKRPVGIVELYQQLLIKYGAHEAEHRMMDCLGEMLWSAQRNQTSVDEVVYLDCLKKL